jgi:hypothetical protein
VGRPWQAPVEFERVIFEEAEGAESGTIENPIDGYRVTYRVGDNNSRNRAIADMRRYLMKDDQNVEASHALAATLDFDEGA